MALQILPPHARNSMVIRYARMCAYMERASFGALSSFMYPLLCRFMHDLFLFLFFSLASRKNGGKKNLFISNYHRSDVTVFCARDFRDRIFLRQLARHLMPVFLFLRFLDNPVSRSIGKRSGTLPLPLYIRQVWRISYNPFFEAS